MLENLTRRRIIRQFVLGAASSWCAGLWKTETVLALESPGNQDEITLKLSPNDFPALNRVGGSVLLNVGLEQPIVLSRGEADRFYTVSARCAHLGCTVNRYDPTSQLIRCSCHGSTYHMDGSLAGGPATRGLTALETTYDGSNKIVVRIPGGGFAARSITILGTSGDSKRIKLTFFPSVFTSYEICHWTDLNANPEVIPFSLTPNGPATQKLYRNNVYDPNNPTPLIPLYVDSTGPKGFFSISVIVTEY